MENLENIYLLYIDGTKKRVLCPFQFLTMVNNVAVEFCIFILFNHVNYDEVNMDLLSL